MKLILHIGMPKTGSTALQQALTGMSGSLVAQGVLYPLVTANPVNHSFLALSQLDTENLPRRFGQLYGDRQDLVKRDFERSWAQVKKQVQKCKPHTLVLSSEHLFNRFRVGDGQLLKRLLSELTEDITVVVYLRRPSAFFLSSLQQRSKSSDQLKTPAPVSYRAHIEACENLFGADRVKVLPYDRESLADGDIVKDFMQRFLPGIDAGKRLTGGRQNQSISAESMAILQEYWEIDPARADYSNILDSKRVLLLLHRIERRYNLHQRPALLPGIGEFIDLASVDLLWLRERHGIQFSGVDYAGIGPRENPYQHLGRVAEICVVDTQRKQEIMLRAVHELMTPRIRMPVAVSKWLRRNIGSGWVRSLRKALGWNRDGI